LFNTVLFNFKDLKLISEMGLDGLGLSRVWFMGAEFDALFLHCKLRNPRENLRFQKTISDGFGWFEFERGGL
jgi:hypothetical protein